MKRQGLMPGKIFIRRSDSDWMCHDAGIDFGAQLQGMVYVRYIPHDQLVAVVRRALINAGVAV